MNYVEQLVQTMSDISERCWYAGWMKDTEFALWKAVLSGPMLWGHAMVTAQDIARLKRLSEQSGGWIVFDEQTEETFIASEQWQAIYAARSKTAAE